MKRLIRKKSVPQSLFRLALLIILLTGCGMPDISLSRGGQPEKESPSPEITPSPMQTTEPERQIVTLPLVVHSRHVLAWLKEGDVWLTELSSLLLQDTEQLTRTGEVMSFAWSSDGRRIATFNGREICFYALDGSPGLPCLPLGLDEGQAKLHRELAWSPDGRYLVVWNTENPWDEALIGWHILTLRAGGTASLLAIADPADFSAVLGEDNPETDGISGQPLFLPDGRLVGTMTDKAWCGSGGCAHQLFEFDFSTQRFVPFSIQPGAALWTGERIVLSVDGRRLGTIDENHVGCMDYYGTLGLIPLDTGLPVYETHPQESYHDLALSPDGRRGVVTLGTGCAIENQAVWAVDCGLSEKLEIKAMELWDFEQHTRQRLAPGLGQAWSPGGEAVAFRSCLVEDEDGGWAPTSVAPPWVYVMDMRSLEVVAVGEGSSPAWKP